MKRNTFFCESNQKNQKTKITHSIIIQFINMEEKKNRHVKNIIFYHFKNFEIIYFLHSTSINQSTKL